MHIFPHSYVNFSQLALLKFHLGIGVDGIYSTSAGVMVERCCDLGKFSPILCVGCGVRLLASAELNVRSGLVKVFLIAE